MARSGTCFRETRSVAAVSVSGGALVVTVVCGPPGSGKSIYIAERMQPGDLVVDLDALAVALCGQPCYDQPEGILPFALHCHYAVIDALSIGWPMRHAWIVIRGALRSEREQLARILGAEVVVLDVPAMECLRRIAADPARDVVPYTEWVRRVKGWWVAYEADGDDVREEAA